MKNLYLLFILLSLFGFSSKGQYIEISDPVLKTKLLALFPGCFNAQGEMDTSCNAVTTATSLDLQGGGVGSGNQIRTCYPLRYFHAVQYLNVSHNSIGLDGPLVLPENLVTLICTDQRSEDFIDPYDLQGLPTLPSTLQYLDCHQNGITSFPALPAGLIWFDCSAQRTIFSTYTLLPVLTSLPALPPSLLYLNCGANALTSLPALPSSLTYLDCRGNKADIQGDFQLYHFDGISCLPPLPASLDSLKVRGNNVRCIYDSVTGLIIDTLLPVCGAVNNPNGCAVGSGPVLLASPATISLQAMAGSVSDIVSYTISGSSLSPVSGNITVTTSSSLELSMDSVTFSSSPVIIGYSSSQLLPTKIFVRISAAAPPGSSTGLITNSGGEAADALVSVNEAVFRTYYNTKANLGLNNPGTWSTTADGTGPSPGSLTEGSQTFVISNQMNANYSGSWNVSQTNSSIIVGDGISPLNFTILDGSDNRITGKIDVMNDATLTIQNLFLPTINILADGSTVNFAQTETGDFNNVHIPAISYYNLTLTHGLKTFAEDTTIVRHNLVADAVADLYGLSSSNSIVNCFGDVSFLNGTAFSTYVFDGAIALRMNGSVPVQNLITDGTNNIKLFSLGRDSAGVCNINVSPGTVIELGNEDGGGLFLRGPNATLTTTGGKISFIQYARGAIFDASSKINSNGTSFDILNTDWGINYPARALSFTPNSTIKNLTVNFDHPNTDNEDHVTILDNVDITDSLILINGRVILNPGAILNLRSTASIFGGNSLSYIDGPLRRTGNSGLLFPVGNGFLRYNPVYMGFLSGNAGGSYTVGYMRNGFGNYSIDPATLSLYPDYKIDNEAYWNITAGAAGTVDSINFYYTDSGAHVYQPTQARMAHFDGADWNDLGGIPGILNTLDSGKVMVTGVNEFSPFAFSAITSGVVPVKLSSFTARKQNGTVQLYWTTEQEINTKEFIVERSLDGYKWNELTSVVAAGNSSLKINYYATDFNPAKGINYYRLKQVDLDGRFTYSEIRSVYFGDDGSIVIAPNPAKDKVMIYLPGNKEEVAITIYNGNGQVVKKIYTEEESVQVNLFALSKGIYSIKIAGRNFNEVRKLVVE